MTMRRITMLVVLTAGLISIFGSIESAQVLFKPFAFGMNSRFEDHIRLAKLLLDQGHNIVVLIGTEDRKYMEQRLPNVTYWECLSPVSSTIQHYKAEDHIMGSRTVNLMHHVMWLKTMQLEHCGSFLRNKVLLQNLKATKFDLYMCDVIDICAMIIKGILDLPTVAYTSHGTSPTNAFFPEIMSITPSMLSPVSDDLDFTERLTNCIGHLFTHLGIVPYIDREIEEFAKEHQITVNSPMKNSLVDAIVLVGNDFILEYPRPFMPNIIQVGGWFIDPPKPLIGDLMTFMDKSERHGVVYISFGSLIETYKHKLEVFQGIFEKFPDRKFIWKYKGPSINVPQNVFLIDWVPQNDLLSHQNLRLFITHCGSHSSYESIYHGVPIVAVPLFTDQFGFSHRLVQRLEMGVLVDYQTLTTQSLGDAIDEVLSNATYKQNAMQARSLHLDQQTTPLSRVKFYIEYVIHHKGIKHLASKPLSTLSLLQLSSLDVIIVMLVIFLAIITCALMLLRCLMRCLGFCFRINTKEKSKLQ